MTAAADTLIRDREAEEQPVGFVELFFDLIFVFAITQIAAFMADNVTLVGAGQTLVLFLATWWLWINTSWVTNLLDPERAPVRIMMFSMMLGGLIYAAVLPDAFGASGLAFAILYTAMQVGRSVFAQWSLHRSDEPAVARNFAGVAAWHVASGVLWIGGGLADSDTRLGWWAAAALIDLIGPAAGHWLPFLRGHSTRDWDISGSHLSERCALFIIIALGEIIIVLGQTYAATARDAAATAAVITSFAGCAVMWWIYFDVGAKRASKRMDETDKPGWLARIAYTYLHIPIVAGLIVTAVSDKKLLADPLGDASDALVLTGVLGPALFLVGTMLFKQSTSKNRRIPASHLVGLGALGLVALAGGSASLAVSPMLIVALANLALVIVAVYERLSPREPTAHADDPSVVVEIEG